MGKTIRKYKDTKHHHSLRGNATKSVNMHFAARFDTQHGPNCNSRQNRVFSKHKQMLTQQARNYRKLETNNELQTYYDDAE